MVEVTLTNTRSKAKEAVRPGDDGRVGLYVCGPTVYDRAHIGNARPVVVFDLLYRLLRHLHGPEQVVYVRNYTDVDDKIIARAREIRAGGEDVAAAAARLTEETIRLFEEDMGVLGALAPTHAPRATDWVNDPAKPVDMVRLIERLAERGHAYAAEGHALFAVGSWPAYGSLSRRSLDEMQAGARVEVAPYKRDPMDFVLWKPSSEGEPGWPGPVIDGEPLPRGRPGWHIECSAMSQAFLGERFQIHGGGIDLAFPHHENERAQSCCASGLDDMADIWVHNGYLMVDGEKMSKSLGNFVTVRDLREQGADGQAVRLGLLMTQYSQPLDWTAERLEEAGKTLAFWARRLARYEADKVSDPSDEHVGRAVVEALADDLNTPAAIAAVGAIAREAKGEDRRSGRRLVASARLLGIDLFALPAYAAEVKRLAAHRGEGARVEDEATRDRVDALLAARREARAAKDFARADAIRDGLIAAGLELRDGPQGTSYAPTAAFDPAKLEEIE
ncbi:MAG: cysteine--tRNA ligase [Paracoccaceae bacterium]